MKTEAGVTFARARVFPAENALELIAHELEHVIEFTDGVRLLVEASAGRSGVALRAGAYETRRAIDAGRRVAREVRDARDAQRSPLSTLIHNTQNSTRNPNCH
jgi:hypothetical protein